jgi:hypothetical protein
MLQTHATLADITRPCGTTVTEMAETVLVYRHTSLLFFSKFHHERAAVINFSGTLAAL